MKQQPATLADRQSDFEDTSQYIKPYMFIKGFAVGRELTQTLLALTVARNLHNGQYRKDGTPYIVHTAESMFHADQLWYCRRYDPWLPLCCMMYWKTAANASPAEARNWKTPTISGLTFFI